MEKPVLPDCLADQLSSGFLLQDTRCSQITRSQALQQDLSCGTCVYGINFMLLVAV